MLLNTLSAAFWSLPISGHFALLGAGFLLGKKIYDITKYQTPHYTTFQPDFTEPLYQKPIDRDSLRILATSNFCRVKEDMSIEAISLQEKVCETVKGLFGFNNAASKAKLHYTALKILYVAERAGIDVSEESRDLRFVTNQPLEEQLLAHYEKYKSCLRPHFWSRDNADVKRTRLGSFLTPRYFGDTLRRVGDLVGIARLRRTDKQFTDLRDTLQALNPTQLRGVLRAPINCETLIKALDDWRDNPQAQADLCKPIMDPKFSFDKRLQQEARKRLITSEFVLGTSRDDREKYKPRDIDILLSDLRCGEPTCAFADKWLTLSDDLKETYPADSAKALTQAFILNAAVIGNIPKRELIDVWAPQATLFALQSGETDDAEAIWPHLMDQIGRLDRADQLEVLEAFVDELGQPQMPFVIELNNRIIELYNEIRIEEPQSRFVDMLFATTGSFDAHFADLERLIEAQDSTQVKVHFYAGLVRHLTEQKSARFFGGFRAFERQETLDDARIKLTRQHSIAGQYEECTPELAAHLILTEESLSPHAPAEQIAVLKALCERLGGQRALISSLQTKIIQQQAQLEVTHETVNELIEMVFNTHGSLSVNYPHLEMLIANQPAQIKVHFYEQITLQLQALKDSRSSLAATFTLFEHENELMQAQRELALQYFLTGAHEKCNLERMESLISQEELNQSQYLNEWEALGSDLADRGEHTLAVSALWRVFDLKKADLSERDFETWIPQLDATLNTLHMHNHHYKVLGTCFDYLLHKVRAESIEFRRTDSSILLQNYAQKLIALFEKNHERHGMALQRNTASALQYERTLARLYFIAGSANEWHEGSVTADAQHFYSEAARIGAHTYEQPLYRAARDETGSLKERETSLLQIDLGNNKRTFRESILEWVRIEAPFASNRA